MILGIIVKMDKGRIQTNGSEVKLKSIHKALCQRDYVTKKK